MLGTQQLGTFELGTSGDDAGTFAHGQAQAYISRYGFGQSQASILTFDNNRHAQAQGFIYGQFFSWGQANASIEGIKFDAASTSTASGFTHTPVGVPRGIVLLVSGPNFSHTLSNVTYGGVSLTKIRHDERTSGAQSQTEIWFLGSNIPTGPQTVSFTNGGATLSEFTCLSFTSPNRDIIVNTFDGGNGNGTQVNVLLSYSNKLSLAVISAAPHNPGTGLTGETVDAAGGHINGQYWHGHQTIASQTDFTAGVTQSSHDYAFTVAALTTDTKITLNTYGQAQAFIRANYVHAQAQAHLLTTVNGYAQAQSQTKQVYFSHAQSQADVLQTYQGYGQAQALIGTVYQAYGQAQGQILAFDIEGFAQAQADILAIGYGFGQAQSSILQVYQAYAQAQAYIYRVENGYGQAQSEILQVYYGFGQAQGHIKQIRLGFGQAQGYIPVGESGVGYGQAQASIKASGWVQGQANSLIDSPIKVYSGNSQGYILKSAGYGQAAAFIILHKAWAQAQAQIKNIRIEAHGQARAFIINKKKHGQAQAKIKAAGRGYGQAMAFINKARGQGQAQAKILSFKTQQWAQAQAYMFHVEGVGHTNAQIVQTHPMPNSDGVLVFPGTNSTIGTDTQNALAEIFVEEGTTVTVTLTQALNDGGNLGILPYDSVDNQFFNSPVINTPYVFEFTGPRRKAIIYSYLGDVYRPGLTGIGSYTISGPFAQARAVIRYRQFPVGQAQGYVSIRTVGHGQAKTSILAQISKHGQAQASINNGQAFGQAQAKIDDGSPVIEDLLINANTYIFPHGYSETAFVDFSTYGSDPEDADPIYGDSSDGSWDDSFSEPGFEAPNGWFYFTLTESSFVHFDTYEFLDDEHDTILIIWTGTSESGAWVEVASNDDSDVITSTYESLIEENLLAGTYLVQIGMYGYVVEEESAPLTAHLNIEISPITGTGQAQAFIHQPSPHRFGQAQATIAGVSITYFLTDTFTRVRGVGTGLGTPDVGPAWAFTDGSLGEPVSVDGSRMVFNNNITSDGDPDYGYAYIRSDLNLLNSEFYGEFSLGDTANYVEFDARKGTDYIYTYVDSSGTWTLYSTTSGGAATTASFPLVADTMYAVKFNVTGTTAKFKVWELTDPEPGTWLLTRTDGSFPNTAGDFSMYIDNSAGQAATFNYFDNFNVYIEQVIPRGFGQAQAFILSSLTNKHAQAQARIKATSSKHGQAQARIWLEILDFIGDEIITNASNPYQQVVIEDQPSAYYALNEHLGLSTNPEGMQYPNTAWDNVGLYDLLRQWGAAGFGPFGTVFIDSYALFGDMTTIPGTDGDSAIFSNFVPTAGFNYLHKFGTAQPLTGIGGWTIEFWFKPLELPANTDNIFLIGSTSAAGSGAIRFDYDNGTIKVFFTNSIGGTINGPVSPVALTLNSWHHVVFVSQFSGAGSPTRLWVNNVQGISTSQTLVAPNNTIFIHPNAAGGNQWLMDELAIYDYFLSADRIGVHYSIGLSLPGTAIGHANAYILGPQGFGQAQATIFNPWGHGQAKALINTVPRKYAQAQAYIKGYNTGQAQALITRAKSGHGQSQAIIYRTSIKTAQSKAYITNTTPTGQAQAFIGSERYFVSYNGYQLPGYAQEEQFNTIARIKAYEAPYRDFSFSEYQGLENKSFSLRMLVTGENYLDCKNQIELAGTLVRTKRDGFATLYVQYFDRHFEALTRSIETSANVGNIRTAEYSVEFETKPWLISDVSTTLSGTSIITTTGRTIDNGGWTPVIVTFTGTNVTVSGYTDTGDFTGFISVSGAVIDYTDTTEQLFVGPGVTNFGITGATDLTITYNDRWYL